MSTNPIASYLTYANLQMAAEALYGYQAKGVSFAFFLEPPCHVAHALS